MPQRYKSGDQVQLKSGGPIMTVQEVIDSLGRDNAPAARCQWFSGSKLAQGVFPMSSLIPAAPDKDK